MSRFGIRDWTRSRNIAVNSKQSVQLNVAPVRHVKKFGNLISVSKFLFGEPPLLSTQEPTHKQTDLSYYDVQGKEKSSYWFQWRSGSATNICVFFAFFSTQTYIFTFQLSQKYSCRDVSGSWIAFERTLPADGAPCNNGYSLAWRRCWSYWQWMCPNLCRILFNVANIKIRLAIPFELRRRLYKVTRFCTVRSESCCALIKVVESDVYEPQ
jgi:hypothetical protein